MEKKKFIEQLKNAGVISTDYSIGNCYILLPYGKKLHDKFFDRIQSSVEQDRYQEYQFPLLINEKISDLQAKLFSFKDAVMWVTHSGTKKLKNNYYLRPSGEMQIFPSLAKWIQTYKQLPLRVLVRSPFYRTTTKSPLPLIAGTLGALLMEGYAVHANEEEAIKEITTQTSKLSKYFADIGLPIIVSIRPKKGNYPLSKLTVGFDAILPNSKTIQIASAYYYGNIYSSLLGINYTNHLGKKEIAHQTCIGMPERLLGVTLAIHQDDKGLLLNPIFAPIQVAIVTPPTAKDDIPTQKVIDELKQKLKQNNIEFLYDESTQIPFGKKLQKIEAMGIPIRIEVGATEASKNNITYIRRDTMERTQGVLSDSINEITTILGAIHLNIRERARDTISKSVIKIDNISTLHKTKKIALISWCGNDDCQETIEECPGEILGRKTANGVPPTTSTGICIVCGKPGFDTYFSRRF